METRDFIDNFDLDVAVPITYLLYNVAQIERRTTLRATDAFIR